MSKYKLSHTSEGRLQGVHPFLVATIRLALEESPEDFGIPPYGGLRTAKDQADLYAKGRTDFSTHNKPVTYVDGMSRKSKHQIGKHGYGEAFDVYIYDHKTKRATWNHSRLSTLAVHILKCSELVKEKNQDYKDMVLIWGGNWTRFKDYPHFQIEYI